jgi:hypothetical protein
MDWVRRVSVWVPATILRRPWLSPVAAIVALAVAGSAGHGWFVAVIVVLGVLAVGCVAGLMIGGSGK